MLKSIIYLELIEKVQNAEIIVRNWKHDLMGGKNGDWWPVNDLTNCGVKSLADGTFWKVYN